MNRAQPKPKYISCLFEDSDDIARQIETVNDFEEIFYPYDLDSIALHIRTMYDALCELEEQHLELIARLQPKEVH